jgi:antitoxin component YwqK of YwqJK toxin-antitoxin module
LGPANIIYYHDGSIEREYFYLDGRFHRELGPAVIRYYPDGSIEEECFYINGVSHREFGPATVDYNADGSINQECFYINGEYMGSEECGFWNLWDKLTDDKRRNPELLKYLVKFS